MYERFTDRARKVYQLAQQEAHRFNHDKVDVFHILIALVKEGSGVAANVLKNLDIDLRKIRLEVEKHVITGYIGEVVKGKLPHTEAADCIAPLAVNEAEALGHNYVGTEHLLLGIVREEFTGMPGIAGKVLLGLGLDRTKIRDEVMALIVPVPNDVTSPTVYTKPNQCCFVDMKTNEQCKKQAEFWIGTDGVDDYTHSCEERVKDLRSDGDVVRAFASSGPSIGSLQEITIGKLKNDPLFVAIMQNTEYTYLESFKDLLMRRDTTRGDINRIERCFLTHFVDTLLKNGYTITRTPVTTNSGQFIGVDLAAENQDHSAISVWRFPATCSLKEAKHQKEVRALADAMMNGKMSIVPKGGFFDFGTTDSIFSQYMIHDDRVVARFSSEAFEEITIDYSNESNPSRTVLKKGDIYINATVEHNGKSHLNGRGRLTLRIEKKKGSSSEKYAAITEWCDRVGLDTRGSGDGGEIKEAIRKEMISTVVENVKHFKHALTVEELIDAPKPKKRQLFSHQEKMLRKVLEDKGIVVNPLSDGEATFMNEMADAVDQTTCTCTSLLNGHSSGCPFAPK